MDYKKLNLKITILITAAGVVLLGTIVSRMTSHVSLPVQSLQMGQNQILPVERRNNLIRPIKEFNEEDAQSIKEMKEQMDADRLQQKKIKMLKLQLEQTNLQLEQEKALSEISKLEKDNTGFVNDSNNQGQDKYPDVKVIYIGGTDEKRQAILSINGNNYSVNKNNKPVKNMEVVSISNTSVTLHFTLPQELTTTYEYRPE